MAEYNKNNIIVTTASAFTDVSKTHLEMALKTHQELSRLPNKYLVAKIEKEGELFGNTIHR